MRSDLILTIAALLALPATNSAVNDHDASSRDNWQLFARGNSTFGKLFDFQNYKSLFNKSYSSMVEELARQGLFMTNALGAFISTVRYKHHHQSYYLSVNDMSDRTPDELHAMDNKVLDELLESGHFKRLADRKRSFVHIESTNDDKDVERELLEYVDSHRDEPSARDVLDVIMRSENDQTVLDKIASETGVRMSDDIARRVRVHHQDRPTYLPKNQEPGMRDAKMVAGQTEVKFWQVGWPREIDQPKGFLAKLKAVFTDAEDEQPFEPNKPDEVFADLRGTKCFSAPRRQGKCASCYAFATVAIFEWLYCMKTGEQLEFSEQYMIDCGEAYVQDLVGCSGGSASAAAHFVRNFGLELRHNYPYRGAVQECPYHKDLDPQSTGRIRFDISQGLIVHSHAWPTILESGPILVGVILAPHFQQYRGGVHGFGCGKGMHAMVLVGHGRERGEEYWLLRNSYGTQWGEQGYYKLAKRANCVYAKFGVFYGSQQAVREKDIIKHNGLYDESFVRRHRERLEPIPVDKDAEPK